MLNVVNAVSNGVIIFFKLSTVLANESIVLVILFNLINLKILLNRKQDFHPLLKCGKEQLIHFFFIKIYKFRM